MLAPPAHPASFSAENPLPMKTRPRLPDDIKELMALVRKGKLFDVQNWIATGKRTVPPGPYWFSPLRVAMHESVHLWKISCDDPLYTRALAAKRELLSSFVAGSVTVLQKFIAQQDGDFFRRWNAFALEPTDVVAELHRVKLPRLPGNLLILSALQF